jgi:hypothetical protein
MTDSKDDTQPLLPAPAEIMPELGFQVDGKDGARGLLRDKETVEGLLSVQWALGGDGSGARPNVKVRLDGIRLRCISQKFIFHQSSVGISVPSTSATSWESGR